MKFAPIKMHGCGNWAVAAIIALVTSLQSAERCIAAESITLSGATMGTTYHVKLVPPRSPFAIENLRRDLARVFAEINSQMSTYQPDSEISRFNRAPAGEWFPVSSPTARVAAVALDMSRKTDGALDVTVAPLVRLWHFGVPSEGDGSSPMRLEPPSEAAIEVAHRSVGYQKFAVRDDPPALRKEIDELTIDLSTIAGGYVVDRVAELLDASQLENYMVEVGGEVRARGGRAAGKDWRIAIERPVRNRREIYTAIPLRNAALSTSGDYRNYFEYKGRRYSHIIDPNTGWPMERELGSVSVVADDCLTADAWDTALLILGRQRGFDCADEHGIAALFIPHEASNESVRATRAWRKRFK